MSALLTAVLAATLAATEPPREPPALGLAVNLPDSAPAALRQTALADVRAAGVSSFALELSWPDGGTEAAPVRRRGGDPVRAPHASVGRGPPPRSAARQRSGAGHVPADLAAVAFDDPRLSIRLGRLLDALGPALADFSTLSLGNEADSYFSDKPEELRAFLSLFRGAVEFLKKKAPRLRVGVATASPVDSRFPLVVAAIQQKNPVLLYVYAPFLPDAPFRHRPSAAIDRDWAAILAGAAGRPVAFTEVSYSSARENGSSPERQADFVRRMRKILDRTDRKRLLFARYVPWRDPAPTPVPPGLRRSRPSSGAPRFSPTGGCRSPTAGRSRHGSSSQAAREGRAPKREP